MQWTVRLKGQTLSDTPPHKSSRILALAAIDADLAVKCGQNAIQLKTNRTWKEVKALLRGNPAERHMLNAPNYHVLPYTYPLPYHLLKSYQRYQLLGGMPDMSSGAELGE